jgi:nicotinate dehydrogenase subunit B
MITTMHSDQNESFMDELAARSGADPVEYRLRHLDDARARDVVATAAERFDWKGRTHGTPDRGSGFAFARYKNLAAYCAIAAICHSHPRE